ncbi:MAG TPA: hypothetical protein DER09_11145 [Prolixibacteraceae bacterium]|nr:hypothetical protein [Prolixibacteraceae bacterium]
MKKLIILLIIVVGQTTIARCQKVIQKNLEAKGKTVEMKFDFADTIFIEAWNKSTLALEVSVNIDENQYNEDYTLNVNEKQGTVKLEEVVDFKAIQLKKGKDNCNINSHIIYTLKVPVDLAFSLKTISGQVEIKGTTGEIDVNSISGFIDYAAPVACKAKINISTITGNVYSNLRFDNQKDREMKWVGSDYNLTLNGGGTEMALKTISGDIFLRK